MLHPRSASKQIVVLLPRVGGDFLFAEIGPNGAAPFLQMLDTVEPLPPSMATEGLIGLVARIAEQIGIPAKETIQFDVLPKETLKPFDDVEIYSVIVDIQPDLLPKLRKQYPNSVLISVSTITQDVSSNFFFRPISESYRVLSWPPTKSDAGLGLYDPERKPH